MSDLAICSACSRHVRASEARCPFCDAELTTAMVEPKLAVSPKGMSRSKRYALSAAALATGVAASACGGSSTTQAPANTPDAETETSTGDATAEVLTDATKGETTSDGGADTGATDTSDDSDTGRPCCPPYGCVFPKEGCPGVKV